jgi:hypothetical protein
MYQAGDRHPVLHYVAFVDYCEHGEESWTSVYSDTEAPYRLAKASEQSRRRGESDCCHSDGIPTLAATGDKSQQPVPVAQPHTSSVQ